MLFLLFQLGADHYALDARQIAEVLPLVTIKRLPLAPPGVAGLCNYHGAPVPVVDLSELTLGRPAPTKLSTRLILVHYPDETGHRHLLGLIAEKATETLRREPADFVAAGLSPGGAPYLGPVATETRGLIQWIQVDKLLPAAVRDVLFCQPLSRECCSSTSTTS